ncbi:MAG: peptide chain release factor N(5)-glutamine methyltransferase [Chlamydiae bacterium]|nr:peptide chain release factor N(5)-glutamine methyltransferase [Chlamydiota bacterium]
MKTLGEVFQLSLQFLQKKNIDRSKFLLQEILCHTLQLDKLTLFMSFERPLEDDELERVRAALARLAKGHPLEQIIGQVKFFGCDIAITPDVLIPRPETEILLDLVAKEVSSPVLNVWDICTGSGCMGIAFKKKFPLSQVTLSDISPKALAIARENAKKNGVEVQFHEGDLLAPFTGKKADLILCNPPYISAAEYEQLSPSVKDNEPKLALTSGKTGYEFYERMEGDLPGFLNPGAKICFEIGYNQGNRLLEIFSAPIWTRKRVLNDWSGHCRFFFLEIE